MTTGVRKNGEFCWINILTPQPKEAREFFSKVLGWTYSDMGGMGDLIEAGGGKIGGLFDIDSPQTPKGTPPVIGVMVQVADGDVMAEKARSLGGEAQPPMDIMENGRMVMLKDPNGAQIDLWQPKKQAGTDADRTQHGVPSWFENYATDVDKATNFYADLFEWTPEVMHVPGMDYTTFKIGSEAPIAGLMAMPGDMAGAPPHWSTYFTVNDPDETARLAGELGGTVFVPPLDIPNIGRFAGVMSPQGVRFFVIKYLPRDS